MSKKIILVLLGILLLGLFLRVYKLDQVPIELFGDEIDVGIQANSIMQTGKDYLGNPLPLMFQSFQENRLPLFIYSAIPFVGVFGLNEWGVRLTDVFWGILGIVGIFLLTQKIFNTKVGLFAAGLLAITPWHLQYSRQAGIEALFLLTVLTFAFWTFIKGLKEYKYLVISTILFAISFYTYAISSLFVTIFAVALLLMNFKKILKLGLLKVGILVVLAIIILIPFVNLYISGKATERTSKISILNDQSIVDDIVSRRKYEENSKTSAIWHNKAWSYSDKLLQNYFSSISPNFLFFDGDPNLRHSADMGMIYLFQFILIVLGLILIFTKFRSQSKPIIAWFFIAPIPSIITQDGGFHGSRLILLLLPLTIFSAVGLSFLIENYKRINYKIIFFIILFFFISGIGYYFHRYYNDYSRDSWRFWQIGYRESFEYIKSIDSDYSRIYFNNSYEPALPRFLFWYGYNPEKFQQEINNYKIQKNIAEGFDGFKIGDKYYFGTLTNSDKYNGLDQLLKPGEIYMVSSRDEANFSDWRINPPGRIKVLKTVVNPFNQPIFYVVTKEK